MSQKSRKTVAAPRIDGDLEANEHSHTFTTDEVREIRTDLLQWYEKNHRHLPWRERLLERDPNKRAYSVWVSEVMLQQTQVATVVNYYNRWMAKWPTVEDLSRASLDEVNSLWSGLGYYSRAKRLHEGAKKVVDELGGVIPNNAANLLKQLPGVGRYTAAAIASIAFGEATGVVDGNVIRVLSRLRAIGAESTGNKALESFWELSNKLLEEKRAGDFNQALMEFGATLCTPQTPQCSTCPLQTHCNALKQVEEHKTTAALLLSGKKSSKSCSESAAVANDIEECKFCLPESLWEVSLGVCNYPRKAKKKQPKEETVAVCIVEKSVEWGSHFLFVQRPKTGLLAGLWEFPNIIVEENKKEKSVSLLNSFLKNECGITVQVSKDQASIGEVSHHFSHIHHKYIIHYCNYVGGEKIEKCVQVQRQKRWISREGLKDAALSTAMRKVFIAYEKGNQATSGKNEVKTQGSKKRKQTDAHAGQKQMMLDAFLKSNN